MQALPTIYDIAKETPSAEVASVLRCVIARIATEDPRWRTTYDRLLESQAGSEIKHPESVVLAGESSAEYQPVLLDDLSLDPFAAAEGIREQAEMLGAEDREGSEIDVVSAVIASEIWMAAVGADNLAYAAAKGPDAISSAAAILARVSGNGAAVMPLDPDWPSLKFPQSNVLLAVKRGRLWVSQNGLDADWPTITAAVVTDLSYRARGGSKTHEAALLLGVRMDQLS